MKTIVICPISKTYKRSVGACSRTDYENQIEYEFNGKDINWDDAIGNPTKEVGSLFGFVHNGSHVEIHYVQEIKNCKDRLQEWSNEGTHKFRNVLVLTPKVLTIDWEVWSKDLQITTWREMGTRVVSSKQDILWNYINNIHKIDYDVETKEVFYL